MSAVNNPESFRAEARYQRVCAGCGKGGKHQAHHVVDRQELRHRGLKEWDTRNALRLCPLYVPGSCHTGQTNALNRVELVNLTDDNVEYAFEILGAYAFDYLHRHYAGEDPRLDRALREAEPA